ncbi:hypothetical protein PR048_014210 [Dryococelus australis]|uniref:Uncharacterized protein n=1 Tax=Dryococelus australis TaxID=614101 RepID=A0ABQ9HDK1_9NEOP|nr:hypothetical protein PR048_014210 [Dryococelus australis]
MPRAVLVWRESAVAGGKATRQQGRWRLGLAPRVCAARKHRTRRLSVADNCPHKYTSFLSPIPDGVAPGFSHVGIVSDDAADRRIFSGISRFPPPFHSGAAPYSPRFTLIGSQVFGGRETEIALYADLAPSSAYEPRRPGYCVVSMCFQRGEEEKIGSGPCTPQRTECLVFSLNGCWFGGGGGKARQDAMSDWRKCVLGLLAPLDLKHSAVSYRQAALPSSQTAVVHSALVMAIFHTFPSRVPSTCTASPLLRQRSVGSIRTTLPRASSTSSPLSASLSTGVQCSLGRTASTYATSSGKFLEVTYHLYLSIPLAWQVQPTTDHLARHYPHQKSWKQVSLTLNDLVRDGFGHEGDVAGGTSSLDRRRVVKTYAMYGRRSEVARVTKGLRSAARDESARTPQNFKSTVHRQRRGVTSGGHSLTPLKIGRPCVFRLVASFSSLRSLLGHKYKIGFLAVLPHVPPLHSAAATPHFHYRRGLCRHQPRLAQ